MYICWIVVVDLKVDDWLVCVWKQVKDFIRVVSREMFYKEIL